MSTHSNVHPQVLTDTHGNPLPTHTEVEAKTGRHGENIQTATVHDDRGKVAQTVTVTEKDRGLLTDHRDENPRGARTHSDDVPRGDNRTGTKLDSPRGHRDHPVGAETKGLHADHHDRTGRSGSKSPRKGGSKSPRKNKGGSKSPRKNTSDASNTEVRRTETPVGSERHETTNLVNIATNMKQGELPSNREIQTELMETRAFLDEKERLARRPQEAQVIRDVNQLVAGVEVTLLEKNRDNLFQKFLSDVTLVSSQTQVTPGNKHALRGETAGTFTALRSIITSMAKSQDFRRSFTDLFGIFKELFIVPNAPESGHSAREHLKEGAGKREVAKEHIINPLKNASMQDVPEHKKREALTHLRRIFENLNAHPDTREAYRGLFSVWGYLNDEYYTQLDQSYGQNPDVVRLQSEAQQLVEAYTGGRSLDHFLLYLRRSVHTIQADRDLKDYLQTVRVYFEDSLDHPEKIDTEEGYQRASELINRANAFHYKYRDDPDFNNLYNEINVLLENMRNDPHLNMLQNAVAKVADDLTYRDADGKKVLDTDLIGVLRAEFIPFMLTRIREVPIQGFEISNPEFEYLKVDDMFLTVDDILPDNIRIHTENNTDITMEDLRKPLASHSYLHFKLNGIRPKLNDFYFAYKRAKGMLAKEDEGRANFRVTGTGINMDLKYALVLDNKHAHLGKHTTDLTIDSLEIDILEAKNHSFLLKMGTSLFKKRIADKIEQAIRQKIDEKGEELAELLNNRVLNNLSLDRIKSVAGVANPL